MKNAGWWLLVAAAAVLGYGAGKLGAAIPPSPATVAVPETAPAPASAVPAAAATDDQPLPPGPVLFQTTGTDARVIDGDSLSVRVPGYPEPLKLRLTDIDAPESRQPYGVQAEAELRQLVRGRRLRVVVQDVDHYGRLVARLYAAGRAGEVDVSREMLARGAAWFYPEYARDDALLYVEEDAREAQAGLWNERYRGKRVEPWEWRQRQRSRSQ